MTKKAVTPLTRKVSLAAIAVAGFLFVTALLHPPRKGFTPRSAYPDSKAAPRIATKDFSEIPDSLENPFPFGWKTTLQGAAAQGRFTLHRPNTAEANDSNIRSVWVEVVPAPDGSVFSPEAVNHVAIKYASGVEVRLSPYSTVAPPGRDPTDYFKGLDETLGTGSDLGTVRGATSLEIPENDKGRAVVDYVYDGLRVTVYGNLPLEDVKRIATSIE